MAVAFGRQMGAAAIVLDSAVAADADASGAPVVIVTSAEEARAALGPRSVTTS